MATLVLHEKQPLFKPHQYELFHSNINALRILYSHPLSLSLFLLLPPPMCQLAAPSLPRLHYNRRPGPDCLPASERADNDDDIGHSGGNVGRNPGPLLQVQLCDF